MNKERDLYNEVTGILKRSEPVLNDDVHREYKLIPKIRKIDKKEKSLNVLLENIFSWVFVGWIRHSMIAVSVLLVGFFILQQSIILRKISNLEQQKNFNLTTFSFPVKDKYSGNVVARIAGMKFLIDNNKLSTHEIEKLLDSYNDLEIKYMDILKTINENPELRKYFDEKMPGFDKKKVKL